MQTVATDEVVPKSRRVSSEVFGCQMNKLDAELMLRYDATWLPVGSRSGRSGYPLQHLLRSGTCGRAGGHANDQLQACKMEEPDLILGLTGCVAQHKQEELFDRAPWIDLIIGTRDSTVCPIHRRSQR